MSIAIERVQIPLGSATFAGYLARPEGQEPLPAVLVFMEIFGINAHIRSVVERIAGLGYVALAPDFFHRTGAGMELGYDQAGVEEGRKHLRALSQPQVFDDIDATLAFLDTRADVQHGRYGAIGFCVGGHLAYLAATTGRFKAAASLYGGGIAASAGFGGAPAPLSRAEAIRGRIVFMFGARDALIPLAQVEAIKAAMAAAGVSHEVVLYEGASHGFFCELRQSYDRDTAADAFARLSTLFESELG